MVPALDDVDRTVLSMRDYVALTANADSLAAVVRPSSFLSAVVGCPHGTSSAPWNRASAWF